MIHIVDFGSTKTQAISNVVLKLGYENKIVKWNDCSENDFQKSAGIILSGAPFLFTENDPTRYVEKFYFLKNTSVPILGICFGHQLMGVLFGARVFKGKEVRKKSKIKMLKRDPLFRGLTKIFIMKEDHTEGIDLPDTFELLACSDDYAVEVMKHSTKSTYGVQFHPEVSGINGKTVLRNFLALNPKKNDFDQ